LPVSSATNFPKHASDVTPDDLRRLDEGARGDLDGVDRSEYRDARDIINHLARDVPPK
jgi:hypothetical protein